MTNPDDSKSTVAAQYDSAGTQWHGIRGSAHALLEKPAMVQLLPDLQEKRVLCIGCGFGDECAYLVSLGAAAVVGIDLSKENVRCAKDTYPTLEFHVMDMERLSFEPASFDVIYSSLTIHYVADWRQTLSEMRRVLAPGGAIVLSTHHPAAWSALKDEDDTVKRQLLGFELNKTTGALSLFGNYIHERPVTSKFAGTFEASFYHKTFSGMLRDFRDAGLSVVECVEPAPVPEAKTLDPQFWEVRSRFPLFVVFRLERT